LWFTSRSNLHIVYKRERMKPDMTMSYLFLLCAIPGEAINGVHKQHTNTSQSLAHYTVSANAEEAGSALFRRKRLNAVSAEAKAIRVRYAGVAYDTQYIETTLLPQLASSMFQVEEFLAPSLPVKYTIYTSSLSDEPVKNMLKKVFPDVMPRISFLNLDEDPNDKIRMAAYKNLNLDSVNLASVRRMLADVHLPSTESRLFLGADISFLKRPDDLLKKLQQHEEVVYMIDQLTWKGQIYKVAAYDGPQCGGLLGDLFYVAAGTKIPEEDAHQALKFYAALPHHPPRIKPPCALCDVYSSGLHAMDQFAWAMVLGKVSKGKCVALDTTKYHHAYADGDLEAVHDKQIRWRYSMPAARSPGGIRWIQQSVAPPVAQPPVAQNRSASPSPGKVHSLRFKFMHELRRGVHSGAVRILSVVLVRTGLPVLVAFVATCIWQWQKHAKKMPTLQ